MGRIRLKSVMNVFRLVSSHTAKCRVCRYFVSQNRQMRAATYRSLSARLSSELSSVQSNPAPVPPKCTPRGPSDRRTAAVLDGYVMKRMAAPSRTSQTAQNSAYERVTTLSRR